MCYNELVACNIRRCLVYFLSDSCFCSESSAQLIYSWAICTFHPAFATVDEPFYGIIRLIYFTSFPRLFDIMPVTSSNGRYSEILVEQRKFFVPFEGDQDLCWSKTIIPSLRHDADCLMIGSAVWIQYGRTTGDSIYRAMHMRCVCVAR